MGWARIARTYLGSGHAARGLTAREAQQLFAAVLDGGVNDLELGAVMALQHERGLTLAELSGFHAALAYHRFRLAPPSVPAHPVVIASHTGTSDEANLLPLLALSLRRLGVPVLIHGALNGGGRVTSAHVLRELGVMPCAHLAQVQARLDEHRLAYAPTALLAPGLADLLALKGHLGFDDGARLLAKVLDPFDGAALMVIAAEADRERGLLRELLRAKDCSALLLDGTEGEAFASPRRRPDLELIRAGVAECLFEAEVAPLRNAWMLPSATDAAGTAHWVRRVLDGKVPMPLPLVNQVACCLYGTGYTEDLNQAKAIVAVETGSLAAA